MTEDLNERLSQQLFIGWWEIGLDVVGMIEIDWLMGWLLRKWIYIELCTEN